MVARVRRVLVRVILGLLLFVAAALAAADAALQVPSVRAWIAQRAEQAARSALGAPVEIDAIESMSLLSARLRGVRVLGRDGHALASTEHAYVRVDPFALLTGRLHVSRLDLERPQVELGAPDGHHGGLLALLRRKREQKPHAEPSGGGLSVELSNIRLQQARVSVLLGADRFAAHGLELRGAVDVDQGPLVRVDELKAELTRNGEPLGRMASAHGRRKPNGAAELTLKAEIASARLHAKATLGPKDAAQDQAQPITAHVTVQHFGPDALRRLGVDSDVLTAPVDVRAHASGTTHALRYAATLGTPGGEVTASGRFVAPSTLSATLRIPELRPQRFLRAQVAPVRGVVRVQAEPDPHSDATLVVFALDDAAYDGTKLPRVDARGSFGAGRGLLIEQLDARYADGRAEARGKLGPDGALELSAHVRARALGALPPVKRFAPELSGALLADVHVARSAQGALAAKLALSLREPAFGDVHAEALNVRGKAQGTSAAAAHVRAQLDARAVQVAGVHLDTAALELQGGPRRYLARADFGSRGRARASIVRDGSRVRADARARIVIDEQGGVLGADVDDLRYRPGVVSVDTASLRYAGARAQLTGSYESDGEVALQLRAHAPDLARVLAPLLPHTTPVPGALDLDAHVTGKARRPRLELAANYRHGVVFGMPIDALTLKARADVPQRALAVHVAGQAGGGSVQAELQSTLRQRELSLSALRGAQHALALHIQHVQLASLQTWPEGRFVPERATLSGELQAQGTLAELSLQTDLESRMRFAGDKEPVLVEVAGRYRPDAVELNLDAEDRFGPLLRSHVMTDLARGDLARNLPVLQRMVVERSWKVSVWLGARRIDQLPAFEALRAPKALWPAQVSAQATLAHEPSSEPHGALLVKAAWQPPGLKGGDFPCGLAHAPRFEFEARMAGGDLHTHLAAWENDKPVLALQTQSRAPINDLLEAHPKRARPASVSLQMAELDLSQVPVVCEAAAGYVGGTATLQRALTQQVSGSIALHGRDVQVGTAPPFQASLQAHADLNALLATAKLAVADGDASIKARVPFDPHGMLPSISLDEPARADIVLRHMSAAALLKPLPFLDARAGQIAGRLAMTGTLRNPSLQGQIEFHDVDATLGQAGQRFENLTGKLAIDDRKLHLYPTKLHDRNGSLELSGDLTMFSPLSWQAQITAKANNFPVRRSGVMLARFGGSLDVSANVDPSAARLDVGLSHARLALTGESLAGVQSLAPHADIVFANGPPPPEQQKPKGPPMPLVLRVHSDEPFWVRRQDFSALITPDLRIEVKDGETQINGPVVIQRGIVELLGRLFDIQQGRIEFAGGHEVEPTLELTAMRRVPGGATVTIEASGTLYQPTLTFMVDGKNVTAGEALATATGASTGTGSGSNVQQQLSSMALGIATGVLTVGARRELGEWVPVLAIERSENETRLRAGVAAERLVPGFLRKLIVDAYIEGIFSAGQGPPSVASASSPAPSNLDTEAGVLLELRFPKHLVGEAQYGPGQRWSLDLNWQP